MRVYLGLGSNLGDRAGILRDAVAALESRGARVVARSSLYETDPVGGPPGQPTYLNQVVAVAWEGTLRELLGAAQAVEAALGRDRTREERWGPRTLDVDLLLAEDAADDPDLIVPHPRLAERAFALLPLAEIAPDASIGGRRAADLAATADRSGVRRV